ncbi:kinase-like domain-containing protein [Cercophora newfieldiana]|uniref:non-specific serine/threonine protein kinase n=1 Tax=Cercophora newfieldiana TaxID=92897 RepID=A0AA40CKP5_9PEZI|nr:kinase-like domain-containing protein [Cercophora newfieldiana]
MPSSTDSADEGEIVEAPSLLPRNEQGGDVDRAGRHRGRFSQTPEDDVRSRHSGDGYGRRSRSPRGWKRPRDDRDARDSHDRRDPRHFRVHYEQNTRDDRRHYRDLDRPVSRGSHRASDDRPNPYSGNRGENGPASRPSGSHRPDPRSRDHDFDRGANGYPDKRARRRSRSPRDRRDRGNRDRGRYGSDRPQEEHKYSAHAESHPRVDSMSKRAAPADAPNPKQNAKYDQGATVERGINGLAISQQGPNPQNTAQNAEPEPDLDWDPSAAMDEEAAQEAEIQRRRRAREAALKRATTNGAVAPAVQALQGAETHPSTPGSTRQATPAPPRTDANTPNSNNPSTPALSPSRVQEAMSPAALNFVDDQDLVKTNGGVKLSDVDGPSAADYDPTADMREDERRDEMRYGNVGLHGEARRPSQVLASADAPAEPAAAPKKGADDDDDFDMFAEDFDDSLAPAPSKAVPAQDGLAAQVGAGGGGNVDGDDKDGYYKIRPGEILDGRYQLSTALGRGMFSGVARALDLTTNEAVAIKIMRNNDALRKGGYTEIAILQKLNAADPENKKHLIKFERFFEYKGHLCMVFENLSLNLREVLKKFGNNVGINLNATRAYAYQIFLALGHMRKCSIIHADLKPDNILVNEARNLLKICDLGTAIDRSDAATASTEITPYLVSRFYRAPEIILGLPYDYAVDMWSIGCTLYELYTGKILFTGDSNNQMLKNIMEIRGKLSQKLYRRGQLAGLHFDELGNFLSVERDKVYNKTTVRTLAVVKPTRDLRTRLLAASSDLSDTETRELNHFVDLLERCLTLNPDKRLTPSEALRHPFFTHRTQLSSRH